MRLAQVGESRDFVSSLNVAVHMVQNIASSRGARNILIKFRKNNFYIGLIKVPSYYKNSARCKDMMHLCIHSQRSYHI